MNRVIVVLGAQNSTGALVARQYGNEDYDVVLVADNAHCVQALATILESEDISTRTLKGDFSKPEYASALIRSIRSITGVIDTIYYGTGPVHTSDYAPSQSLDSSSEVSNEACLSMAAVVIEVLPEMRSRKVGSILLNCSNRNLQEVLSFCEAAQAKNSCSSRKGFQEELMADGVNIGIVKIESMFCRHNTHHAKHDRSTVSSL